MGPIAHIWCMQPCGLGLFRYLFCLVSGLIVQASKVCDIVRIPHIRILLYMSNAFSCMEPFSIMRSPRHKGP